MNPKLRNALAETIQLLGLVQGFVPQFTAISHVPAWVGPSLSLVVAILNQLYKDSTPPPTNPDGTKSTS